MKTKILTLTLLTSIFMACSVDDSPVEPIVEQPIPKCDTFIKRYRVNTLSNGTPVDTIYLYGGYRQGENGLLYQENCGSNRWQIDLSTYYTSFGDTNPFAYETENFISE